MLRTLAAAVELIRQGSIPSDVLRGDVNVGLAIVVQAVSNLPSTQQADVRLAVSRRAVAVSVEPGATVGLSAYAAMMKMMKMMKQHMHILHEASAVHELRSAIEEWKRVDWPQTTKGAAFREWYGHKLLESTPVR